MAATSNFSRGSWRSVFRFARARFGFGFGFGVGIVAFLDSEFPTPGPFIASGANKAEKTIEFINRLIGNISFSICPVAACTGGIGSRICAR
jgi:hypothetical protein